MTPHLTVIRERLADFQQKTKVDPILQGLKETIELGWPERREAVPSEIRAFYSYRDELTVQGEILFKENRVIVPAAIRSAILKKIHASHVGIEGSLRPEREILYWPGITAAIGDHVSVCGTCSSFRMEQSNSPHQISKHLLESGTSSISPLLHAMLDQTEKSRKQLQSN